MSKVNPAATPRYAMKGGQIQEVDPEEIEYEFTGANTFFGSHANLIPMQSAVQAPRIFYGARFYNQALPLVNREQPLVQNAMDDGRSYDEDLGGFAGAMRADDDGEVVDVTPDEITFRTVDGQTKSLGLYRHFPFNRKSAKTQFAKVSKGQQVKKGDLMATSNFTDDQGTLALGLNARVGLVPYKGWSMDDAIVISESFAKRLASEQSYTLGQDFDDNTKGGRNHFVSLFPSTFEKKQLDQIDDDGVVKVGSILRQGDPFILATAPKIVTSKDAQVGKLSRALQQTRKNASQTWDYEDDGEVVDVAKGRKGVKVVVRSVSPTKKGDKITMRSGQKNIVSRILPDEQMLRTVDGKPLDALLNQLSIPSRVNDSLPYELLLGKVARVIGKPIKIPSFNKPGEKWYEFVQQQLDEHGLKATEDVFDPATNKALENPITVGEGYILKLHHTGESKKSSRGIASYDQDQQPSRGGGEGAQAKRLSGLETNAMLSAGAYQTLKEGATLRGQQNDEYWRALRSGHTPQKPGAPFVWTKFMTLLNGSGLHARKLGKTGKLRLGPFTDASLMEEKPVEIKNGEIVDLGTLEPVAGGLFDPALVGANKWGMISLPHAVPNPAFEDSIRTLLGLTKKDFREVMAGRKNLE